MRDAADALFVDGPEARRGLRARRDRGAAQQNSEGFEREIAGGRGQIQIHVGADSGKPTPLENVYAILPGSDPKLAKSIFIVSGHFDSRPSNVMDPEADTPGADDDASGVAVSRWSARDC